MTVDLDKTATRAFPPQNEEATLDIRTTGTPSDGCVPKANQTTGAPQLVGCVPKTNQTTGSHAGSTPKNDRPATRPSRPESLKDPNRNDQTFAQDRPYKTLAKTRITQYFNTVKHTTNNSQSHQERDNTVATISTPSTSKSRDSSVGKSPNSYKTIVKQVNLQKKKSANRTYFQELKCNEILLGQEPYFHKNKLVSVPTTHKPFVPYHKDKPRVCIILPIELGKISYCMTPFCNRDMITVRCNIKKRKDIIFCSLYMGHEPNKPEVDIDTVDKMSKLVAFSKTKNLALVMGADSNGHHILWNSFKKNDRRGTMLAQLIEKLELSVLNRGKSPTFVNSRGHQSIIDITMANTVGCKLISNWRVDKRPSLSDHKLITFDIDMGNNWESYTRNIKDMDQEKFRKVVTEKMEARPFIAKIGKFKKSNIDSSVNYLNKILSDSMDEVCPMIKVNHKSKIPWSKELNTLKREAKQAKNRKITALSRSHPRSEEDLKILTEDNKKAENEYKNAIGLKDRQAYRDYCSNISQTRQLARVPKSKRQPWEELTVLKKPDGSYTEETEDTLKTLADEHFPADNQNVGLEALQPSSTALEEIDIISNILNPSRIELVIKKLPINQAPGIDGIRNSMIKAAWEPISKPLSHIYSECFLNTYCPKAWKTSKGIIIPKEGKDDYTNPRAFRIISLTSNLQKLLERLILDYLERVTKVDNKLTKNQFGFRKRKSTEAAIHRLTRKIEDAIQNGQFGLGVFLDVEGAFDNVRYSSIYKAMLEAKIPHIIANWIKEMLIDRTIVLTLHGISIKREIHKGCPQGGILSPLLWNLTLNTLLTSENIDDDFIQAFADDLAILIHLQGFDLSVTMRDIVNRYLKVISKWCNNNGVKLSTIKTKVIVFSALKRKYKLKPVVLDGQNIEFSDEVKYLGVTFEKHLRWDTRIRNKCAQATKLLHMCRNFVAKSWGL